MSEATPMLNSELRHPGPAKGDPDPAEGTPRDGRRLDHAADTSRPMSSGAPKPAPRGATIHANRFVDQGDAAGRFVAAAEHDAALPSILRDHRARRPVRNSSMLTKACSSRGFMAGHGVEVIGTDLGERIQPLDGEAPGHVVVPVMHRLRSDVARAFTGTPGSDHGPRDAHSLAGRQRDATRPLILAAGMTARTARWRKAGPPRSVRPVRSNIDERIADWRRVASRTHKLALLKKAAGVLPCSPNGAPLDRPRSGIKFRGPCFLESRPAHDRRVRRPMAGGRRDAVAPSANRSSAGTG